MKTILESQIYLSDVARVAKSLNWINLPSDSTFLVTGATGLICSSVVDVLEELCISNRLNWNIIIAVRNIQKAKIWFSRYESFHNVFFYEYDVFKPIAFPLDINYCIHGAGNAYPAAISNYPVDTLTGSLSGLNNLLRYSVDSTNFRVLYISSSEVYGVLQNNEPIKEEEYGYIDILNSRSSYSMGKRAAETLCSSFLAEFDADCVIVRPGHIYGPTASTQDNRVSSMFMYSAAQGQDLVLKSRGEQVRSYCYCLDCASAIVSTLFKGQKGQAYNISNKHSICSIKEMAEQFARAGNVRVVYDFPSDREKQAFNPMLNSSLDSSKLEALGWNPFFAKEEGFIHSVNICKEVME